MTGANLPLAALRTFILWIGWFGLNGGSQLAICSAAEAFDIAAIYVDTNLGGRVAATFLTQAL